MSASRCPGFTQSYPRLFESSELYLTEPDTLGGRPKLPGSEHTATVDRLADELSWPTGTAAVYGRADGPDLGFDLPGRRMAMLLSTLEKEGMATAELWPKAPWPFDGLVRCGQTTYLNAPAAVCAWSDDGTLGVIIAPAGSAGAMRDVPEAMYAARTSFGCRSRGAVAAAVESFGGTWTYLWPGDFMEKHPAVGAADQGDRHRRRALAGRGQHTRGDGRHRGGRRGRTAAGRDYGRAYSITGPEILTRVDSSDASARPPDSTSGSSRRPTTTL